MKTWSGKTFIAIILLLVGSVAGDAVLLHTLGFSFNENNSFDSLPMARFIVTLLSPLPLITLGFSGSRADDRNIVALIIFRQSLYG